MPLGLGAGLSKSGIVTPGIVTDNLVLKHNYNAGVVVPVSDGAAYFDGTNDYIQTPDAFDHNNITVSAWIRRTGDLSITRCIWSNRQADDEAVLFYVSQSGNQTVKINGTGSSSGGAIDANRWYHVAFTWDGSTMKQYKDGVLVTTDSKSGTMTAGGSNARIGADAHSDRYWWEGNICNVGVWSGVLTQAQIKSIMWGNYSGLTTSEKTNLVSWWNLDSTVGTGIGDDATNVFDNHYAGGNALGSNLVANPNFDDETNWTDQNIGASDDVDLSTEQVYIGTNSLKIIGTADHDGSAAILSSGGTVGELYKISARFYVLSGVAELNPGDARFTASTDLERWTSTTNQWEQLVTYGRCISTGTGGALYVSSRGGAATFYVDDVRIEEVQGNPGELK